MEGNRKTNIFLWLDKLDFSRFHVSTLIITVLILCAAGFNLQILAYAMPLIVKEWGLSPVEGGTMVSWGFLGLMAGAMSFGPLADRIGRKKGLMVAISIFSLVGSATSLAPGYTSLCTLRFFTGYGIGGAFPLAIALLSEFSPAKSRARLVTAAVSGFTMGWAMAASASMVFIPLFGWRTGFQLGILSLLLLPFVWGLVPESVRFLVEKGHCSVALREVGKIERLAGLRPSQWSPADIALAMTPSSGNISQLFQGRLAAMTILLWTTYLLNTMTLYGLSVWLPSLLVREGFPLIKSCVYAMIQAGGAAAGGFLLGCLMDRFGRKPGLIFTYFFGGMSIILFGLARTDLHFLLSGAATGVFVVGAPTALNVVSSEIYPTGVRSTGIASTQAVGRIGSIVGPIVGGLLQAFGFSFHQFFFLFAIPCFVCMLLVAGYPINVRGEALEEVSRRLGYCK